MISGKYGSDDTLTDFAHAAGWTPGYIYNSHNKQLRKQLIGDLRSIGYTDDQISAGLSSGAIEVGNYDRDTNKFLPFSDKKQQRNLRRVAKHDSDIKNKYKELESGNENEPNETLPDDDSEVIQQEQHPQPEKEIPDSNGEQTSVGANEGFDGTFPWDSIKQIAWTPKRPRVPAKNNNVAQTSPQAEPVQPVHQKLEPLAPVQAPANMSTGVTAPVQPGLIQRQPQQSLAQSTVQVMNQTANQNNMALKNRIATNKRTRQNANNAINQMVRDGSMSRSQAKNDKNMIKGAEKALRTGQSNQ